MRSLHLGTMAAVAMAGAMMATPSVDLAHPEERRAEPKPKYKAPLRNDEMHIKAAADKRARRAAKRAEIESRRAAA